MWVGIWLEWASSSVGRLAGTGTVSWELGEGGCVEPGWLWLAPA